MESQFQSDSFKRFEMLLKKTETFSHCLSAGDVEMAGARQIFGMASLMPNLESLNQKDVASKSSKGGHQRIETEGDHRHRKTEKEEDEELINQVKRSETLVRHVCLQL
ncbi:unnamed protein product [Gongylonema pulchrum]|uniref:BAR domain-containing protein n=1 Tax=Gongylonema pulchrum TaxID=637853 RepID=A0A183ENZ3_9BILA|nr:unnamed protein product [Gongylonema pulchrum]